MFAQEITVVRAPALVSESGADAAQRDWDAATETVVTGVNVQPMQADANSLSTAPTWRLFTDEGDLDLLSTDRVLFDGMTLEVDGSPQRWPWPGGGVHHIEARLRLAGLELTAASGSATNAVRDAAQAAAQSVWTPRT